MCNRSLKSVPTSCTAGRLRCRWSGRWFRAVVYVEEGKSGLSASKWRTSESSAGVVPTFWTPSWDILSFCTLFSKHTCTPWTYIRHIMMLMKQFRCFEVQEFFFLSLLALLTHSNQPASKTHVQVHHSLSYLGSFYLLFSVIKGLVLRLAHMLGEKLLKQHAVAIRRQLEFIHSPHRKSNASILVIAYMEFQDCAFWKNQAFFSLSNQVFL